MKVYRYEESFENINNIEGSSVFLAGPTVRGNQPHLTSWRFDAIDEFQKQGYGGSLIVPEFTKKTESDKGKDWIPLWEYNGLKKADIIMFWIPRTRELIGLTTNWELGYWMGNEPKKIIYGRPDDAYRIRYLDIMWETILADKQIYVSQIWNTMESIVNTTIRRINLKYQ
jgi:nucleoside 2-deoxyribosyltransferase